jgi:hypothetical protein
MKKLFFMLSAAVALVGLSSCEKIEGEGPVVIQERAMQHFKNVSVGVGGKVNYKIDPVYKVEIQAQQNILDILETVMNGEELVIKFKNGVNVRSHEQIVINISAPVAEGVSLGGSAEFTLTGPLTGDHLSLRVSGSGNIQVQQATLANRLDATISGSGNITVQQGTANNEMLKISGSGNINMADFTVFKANADISGSGNVKVNASQQLEASISGSGSIYYRGTPVVSTQISGSGSVRPL